MAVTLLSTSLAFASEVNSEDAQVQTARSVLISLASGDKGSIRSGISPNQYIQHNKALVKDFVETILKNGQLDKLSSYFDGDNYIQHNPGIGDGLSGLGKALGEMAKQGIIMKYDKVHMVLGQGNFVMVVSEGIFGGKPTSYYDLFHVQNGKIAEHWDVMENILPDAERKNQSGKFSVGDQDVKAINHIIQQYAKSIDAADVQLGTTIW